MKIGNNPSTAAPPASATATDRSSRSTGQATTATATASASASQPDASAQVDLSPTASLLSSGTADPTFDSAKVDRIAQAIKDGKFSVNADAIADKLISNAQELLGRSSSH